MNERLNHGIAPGAWQALVRVCEGAPGLARLWLFGSRAAGTHRERSDIDLLIDAPGWTAEQALRFADALKQASAVYGVDAVWWQGSLEEAFRVAILDQRRVLWQPAASRLSARTVGAGVELKDFQEQVLSQFDGYLDELNRQAALVARNRPALQAMEDQEGMETLVREAGDFPKKAWAALKRLGQLPKAFADLPHSSRFDGAGRPIPNVCLKVPTGGGKTLLAAASVAKVFGRYLQRHTGLVLWVVPNEAIYRQTLKTLSDRDHPYHQMLNVAGAGRVKILEKNSPLSRMDVSSNLCVMVLMLAAAARVNKETLRFFRDRGNVLGFLPREDDLAAHFQLLQQVPNLDAYGSAHQTTAERQAQMGSVVKSSLGNVMRLLRPMVVIDEGQHAYTENALSTLDGFNPSLVLELSATPRVASATGRGSNILVDVRGTDLELASMIKLPIHVEVRPWNDWRACLAASLQQLDTLQREAEALQAETARYIRPILLVQVERTGADLRDAGFIHAEDAKAYLMQLGLSERQIAIKTSEKNDLKQPENIDLLSPLCEVRAIITKQALQEGWDCPFAYVLCALAAGRNPAAMTQLVGRILRQPQVTKTGRAALDACYVECFDASTAAVVKAIKHSLEGEGMGDLAVTVNGGSGASGDGTETTAQRIALKRRPALAHLRLFLPKVTWVERRGDAVVRRELVYESDVLAALDWAALDVQRLAKDWAPNGDVLGPQSIQIDLSILRRDWVQSVALADGVDTQLDRARLVRSVIDLAPNAWLVWGWVEQVVARLLAQGLTEQGLARSQTSLMERLRLDLEAERDRLAQVAFNRLVEAGQIEFSLRADQADYALPMEDTLLADALPPTLQRPDAGAVQKSLLEPALRTSDMNDLEAAFAGYLDQKSALQWWHRNVAKTQYGLQGWRKHKVYPDFVFAMHTQAGQTRTVLMETKGLQLAGNADTAYKQALLERLTQAFKDERLFPVGDLRLEGMEPTEVRCDLIFEGDWRGTLERRHFAD
jgi:type III restriction enzyme